MIQSTRTNSNTKRDDKCWNLVKIKDICQVVNGTTPETFNPLYWDGDIVWITPKDLGKNNDIFISNSERKITVSGLNDSKLEIVPSNSIIISSRAPIGHIAINQVPACTNQGCKSLILNPGVNPLFLYYCMKFFMPKLKELGNGATFKEVSKSIVENFEIIIPNIDEQNRIAAILGNQFGNIGKISSIIESQIELSRHLITTYLREIFDTDESKNWPKVKINEVVDILPSSSVSNYGTESVPVITTACLNEFGFQEYGVKTALMKEGDLMSARIKKGEILIARSNTPELVGRVSQYTGEPGKYFVCDLTIRLFPKIEYSGYIARYLSYLFTKGYWKEIAGGASGTMKKITKEQIRQLSIPLPPKDVRKEIELFLDSSLNRVYIIQKICDEQLEFLKKYNEKILTEAFSEG